MNSIMQLIRKPGKTILGILFSLLACAIICICLGQYIAAAQTQMYVEENYTTVGLLTSKYMQDEIFDEDGKSIGRVYYSEQPEKVKKFLDILSQNVYPYVKNVQQNLLISGYVDDVIPLNYHGLGIKPIDIDANAANIVEMHPYTCAMLLIKVDEVGEIRPFIDYETSIAIDSRTYGYVIELKGVVLEKLSLQAGYSEPEGKTIWITLRFDSEKEIMDLELQSGQTYVVCGTDYQDLDAQLRIDIAKFCELEVSEIDWGNLEWYKEEELSGNSFDWEAYYPNGNKVGYTLSKADVQDINSCSLTVCTNPLLYSGIIEQDELRLLSGEVVSTEEYIERFKDSKISLLNGSRKFFLKRMDDSFWQEWLQTAYINDHSFPVLAVDDLNAVSQFAIQDAFIVEGRAFTDTEEDVDKKMCVISESLAVANGLSVDDYISIQFYKTDIEMNANKSVVKLANPGAAYYSAEEGFLSGTESYKIIGLYRQKNQWANGTYCFTPNTIFVSKKTVPEGTSSICGGIYTSVILENGTSSQLEQLAAENGLDGALIYYDQGYSDIMDSLQSYFEVGRIVLWVGLCLWGSIVLLFLFLYPYQLLSDLKRMRELGTPLAQIYRHFGVSSVGVLLPGTVLGCIMSVCLFDRIVQRFITQRDITLTLEISIETLVLMAAMQMLITIVLVFFVVCILTTGLKKYSGRK